MRKFWWALLALGIGGIAAGAILSRAMYLDLKGYGLLLILAAACMGATGLIALGGRRRRKLTVSLSLAALVIALAYVSGVLIWTARVDALHLGCRRHLRQIAGAMEQYYWQQDLRYLPYDERGPLESLSLLYPRFMDDPVVFECPRVSLFWTRRHERNMVKFPAGTSLAGRPCQYGYTWRAAPRWHTGVIVADRPGNHENIGYNVLYTDWSTLWTVSPFDSYNPKDNIFSPEPGWGADTDSYIRQAP